jgi:hypothetical protein
MESTTGPKYVDESQFFTKHNPEGLAELQARVKPFFTKYIYDRVLEKPGANPEIIQLDMLHHIISLRHSELAKNVVMFRMAKELQKAEWMWRKLQDLRFFWLAHYDLKHPDDWSEWQNEMTDDLDVILNKDAFSEDKIKAFLQEQNLDAHIKLNEFIQYLPKMSDAEINRYLKEAFDELKVRAKADEEQVAASPLEETD